MSQVIFWLNFDKANHSFFHLFLLLVERDDKNLGASFEWGRSLVKIPRFNAFSRNVNTINLKIFPTHGGIYTNSFLYGDWHILKKHWLTEKERINGNIGLRHLCTLILGFQENSMQSLSAVFWVIKKNRF